MKRGYFASIVAAARSTAEGLAVTFAQMLRRPTTVQYPEAPVKDSLPERYRGFLEVDLEICTACKACERDCPIHVIAIDVEKQGDQRGMTRFDIDMGKCMYCNICVESCPVPGQAPGDVEPTKAIRMTREFEGATSQFETLTFRFIKHGQFVAPFKYKKGETPPTRERGEIARHAREDARVENPPAFRWAWARQRLDEIVAETPRRAEALKPLVDAARDLPGLMVAEATPQTDCEQCGYPTCRAYAEALATGQDAEPGKCAPGGARTTRDLVLILELRAHLPEDAARTAADVTRKRHA